MDDTLGLNTYTTDKEATYVPYIHLNWNYYKQISGQNFFICWFTNPPTVIFQKAEKK